MSESRESASELWSLVAVPAALTLAVTLLRLTGELLHWSPRFFSAAPGGGGALVGISWLPLVFGVFFAWKLAREGRGPRRVAAGLGLVVLAIALLPAAGFVAARLGVPTTSLTMLGIFAAVSLAATWIAMRAWPELGRTLFAYGLAARLPVAVLMLFAILGSWGTHYDALPPDFPPGIAPFTTWLLIGLLPQLTIWIAFTVAVGSLTGILAGAFFRRKAAA